MPTSEARFRTALANPRPRTVATTDPISAVSFTLDGTSTISGATTYLRGDPKVRYFAGKDRNLAGYPLDDFAEIVPAHWGANAIRSDPAGIEVITTGRYLEIEQHDSHAHKTRVMVNGQLTHATGYTCYQTITGNIGFLKLDFGSADTRCVKALVPGLVGRVKTDAPLLANPVAYPCNMVVFGDSIAEGTGASHPHNGFVYVLGELLGVDNCWPSALGGTGYVLPGPLGRVNLKDRIDAELELVPTADPRLDVILFTMGINDPWPSDVFATNTGYSFNRARTRWPDAVIFASGPLHGYDVANGSQQAKAAIIRGLCGDYDMHFIDVEGWITSADAGAYFPGGYGDPHPNDAGHAYYASKFNTAMRQAMAPWEADTPASGAWQIQINSNGTWAIVPGP